MYGPDGILDDDIRGGGAILHPTSSIVELKSAVSSNVKVVHDQPVSTTGGRGDSTSMRSKNVAIPDMSSTIGGTSLSGIRSHQDRSSSHASPQGSIHAVRRIPDETVIVSCSATLVSVV